MAEQLSDGTISWIGGMDTSRAPVDLDQTQYFKGINVMIPDSLGGIQCRWGYRCLFLEFDTPFSKEIYQTGHVQGEGSFIVSGRHYLIVVVNGYVFRWNEIRYGQYYVEMLNKNDPNDINLAKAWVIPIPGGCIVNNGFNYPLAVTDGTQRRTDPDKGEIGIGQMGVYVQHRLFYVDQSGKQIIAGDFNQPLMNTEYSVYGNTGFAAPDSDEIITAIAKQKTQLDYIDGGNLVFSTNRDIYSVDVRGTRTEWSNLGESIGKVQETIPDYSACSSYSFEAFNSNIYFRTSKLGICNLRQTEYQYSQFDALTDQSSEASYFLDNDTDWMLDYCYSRAFNRRLLTTIAPERTPDGYTYWNGILIYKPAVQYNNQTAVPRRYEGIWTGVRPWCMTVVKFETKRDILFVHSYDADGINRCYMMDTSVNYDTNDRNQTVEIRGAVETRGYNFAQPFSLKASELRFYRMNQIPRSISLCFYARPETQGEWVQFAEQKHLIKRVFVEDGVFNPQDTKPQDRVFVQLPNENFPECFPGKRFISIQYRMEFKGPMNLNHFAIIANPQTFDKTVTAIEEQERILIYSYRPDFDYLISKEPYGQISPTTSLSCE